MPISPSQSTKEGRGSSRVVHAAPRNISGRLGGEGGSCGGSERQVSGREAARQAEDVPGAGPGPQLCGLRAAGAGPAASRCGRGGAALAPRLRSAVGASEKRREQGGRDTRPRFPPGVRTPDHGSFCRGSPLGSLTFLASRTRGARLAGVGVVLPQGWEAEQQQVGLGCGSL